MGTAEWLLVVALFFGLALPISARAGLLSITVTERVDSVLGLLAAVSLGYIMFYLVAYAVA